MIKTIYFRFFSIFILGNGVVTSAYSDSSTQTESAGGSEAVEATLGVGGVVATGFFANFLKSISGKKNKENREDKKSQKNEVELNSLNNKKLQNDENRGESVAPAKKDLIGIGEQKEKDDSKKGISSNSAVTEKSSGVKEEKTARLESVPQKNLLDKAPPLPPRDNAPPLPPKDKALLLSTGDKAPPLSPRDTKAPEKVTKGNNTSDLLKEIRSGDGKKLKPVSVEKNEEKKAPTLLEEIRSAGGKRLKPVSVEKNEEKKAPTLLEEIRSAGGKKLKPVSVEKNEEKKAPTLFEEIRSGKRLNHVEETSHPSSPVVESTQDRMVRRMSTDKLIEMAQMKAKKNSKEEENFNDEEWGDDTSSSSASTTSASQTPAQSHSEMIENQKGEQIYQKEVMDNAVSLTIREKREESVSKGKSDKFENHSSITDALAKRRRSIGGEDEEEGEERTSPHKSEERIGAESPKKLSEEQKKPLESLFGKKEKTPATEPSSQRKSEKERTSSEASPRDARRSEEPRVVENREVRSSARE